MGKEQEAQREQEMRMEQREPRMKQSQEEERTGKRRSQERTELVAEVLRKWRGQTVTSRRLDERMH